MAWLKYSIFTLTLCFCLTGKLNAAKVNLPAIGKVTYWMPGSTVALNWTYSLEGSNLVSRSWSFKSKNEDKVSILVSRYLNNPPQYKSSRNITYIEPSMLLFQNASIADDGTYIFQLGYYDRLSKQIQSEVEVIILEQPTASVSCPSNNKIKEGECFSCFCKGTTGNPPPLATWSKNGVVINGNGFKTKDLVFENVTKHMSGKYICTVRSYNLTDSKVIELLVQYSPKDVNIRTNSSSTFVEVNTAVTIICTADSFPKASYTISRNGITLSSVHGVYIINSVKFSHRGQYDCVAKNIIGKTSRSFQLNVKVRPIASTNCSTTAIEVNENNPFNCLCKSIGGYPPPNASWTKVGQDVEINGVGYLKKTLSFNSISRTDTGNYSCKVQSLDLFDSITIQVRVRFKPELLFFGSDATDSSAKAKSRVKISWKANGYPRPKFALYKDTKRLKINVYHEEYIISSVNSADAGKYECRAKNNLGQDTKSFSLVVIGQPNATTNCSRDQPNEVEEGETLACSCSSIGGSPPPNASWTENGKSGVIDGVGYLTKTLLFSHISRNDTGKYTCKVQSLNLFDEISIEVHVKFKPAIASFESSKSSSIVTYGTSVKITCTGHGYPEPDYTILHNDKQLENVYDGNYAISSVKYSDSGKYECVMNNSLGRVSKSFGVTVTGSCKSSTEIEWYIVLIAILVGIFVGATSVFAAVWLRRRLRKREDGSSTSPQEAGSPGRRPEGSQNAVYQELDLKKMNEGDNYQSLRTNFRNARSNQAVDENESGYQELNKIRERGDENYQSLNRV